MNIVIAATQVDTLRYRLYAQAELPAERGQAAAVQGARTARSPQAARRHRAREGLAVASGAAPVEAGRRRPGQTDILTHVLDQAEVSDLFIHTTDAGTGARWSAAVRALRERTYREVQAQIEHFVRTTGRDWQLQSLAYGEPVPGQANAMARLTLVTEVVLAARIPRLH